MYLQQKAFAITCLLLNRHFACPFSLTFEPPIHLSVIARYLQQNGFDITHLPVKQGLP